MKLELKAFQTSLCCSLFIEQKYSFLKVQVENFKIINEKVKIIDCISYVKTRIFYHYYNGEEKLYHIFRYPINNLMKIRKSATFCGNTIFLFKTRKLLTI